MDKIIQIAGVRDLDEGLWLAESGATHLGFPLKLGYHKPDTSEEEARKIIAHLPKKIIPVLITYIHEPKEIIDFCHFLNVTAIQLHGAISQEELRKIRSIKQDLFIIKSLIVRSDNSEKLLAETREFSPYVDAFITDTFDPSTGATGATGKTHDWRVSQKLVEVSSKPVILAGGLNADNVREAILQVKPLGVDSHTGVEDVSGCKSRDKVFKFIQRAQDAF